MSPGANVLVRNEEVRVKGETLKRPVTKVCLLEAVNDEKEMNFEEHCTNLNECSDYLLLNL